MTTTHIHGPWHMAPARALDVNTVIVDPNGVLIASVIRGTLDPDANARLIAAAPDLLAALTLAHGLLTGLPLGRVPGSELDQAALTYIQTVLAKAEGTTP